MSYALYVKIANIFNESFYFIRETRGIKIIQLLLFKLISCRNYRQHKKVRNMRTDYLKNAITLIIRYFSNTFKLRVNFLFIVSVYIRLTFSDKKSFPI